MAGNPACEAFIPMLSAYVDGELPPRERGSVEVHLAACRECAGRAADFRAGSGLVRIGLEMAADEVDFTGFAQKVVARLTPYKLPLMERWRIWLAETFRHQRGVLVSSLAVVAAVLLAGVAGPLLWQREPPPGYAQQRMVLKSVSIEPGAHVSPVVLTTESGDAIIWLVDHEHVLHEPGALHDEDEEENVRSPSPAPVAPARGALPQEPPKGGEL